MNNTDNMDDKAGTVDTHRMENDEVLELAMLNALNDEQNYLGPVKSWNLDSYQARIAHNVILRSKSINAILRESDDADESKSISSESDDADESKSTSSESDDANDWVLDVDQFFISAIAVCQNLISSYLFADNHCKIMAIACDMFYRLDGSVNDAWSSPQLSVRCTEIWQLTPDEDDEKSQLFLNRWEKQNSFISHLVSRGYRDGLCWGLEEIGAALEHPIAEECPRLMRCRVRVAAEWITNCGDLLLTDMSDQKDTPGKKKRPGPLYGEELPYRSLDRWEFWKKRLAEFQGKFHLQDETNERVATALELMQAPPSEWEKRNSSLERAIKKQLEIAATEERSNSEEAAG